MAGKFKVGDIVKLKSGGPAMTVKREHEEASSKQPDGTYACQWFAGKKLEIGQFPEDSLEPTTVKPALQDL